MRPLKITPMTLYEPTLKQETAIEFLLMARMLV